MCWVVQLDESLVVRWVLQQVATKGSWMVEMKVALLAALKAFAKAAKKDAP